jgi:hypothetical protein
MSAHTNYPADDLEFEDKTIASVNGGVLKFVEGYSIGMPDGADVVALPGMTARLYGKGLGYSVRGIFVDGVKVFYRTAEEDKRHHIVERFGATPRDWLAKWDRGEACWSLEMGGLGPGYEQCIQITMAQILRHLVDAGYDATRWADDTADRDAIQKFGFADETIKQLGLSGAQWGAALGLASALYMRGPIEVLSPPAMADRLILVSKNFPGVQA